MDRGFQAKADAAISKLEMARNMVKLRVKAMGLEAEAKIRRMQAQVASVTDEQASARDLSLDTSVLGWVIDVLAEDPQRPATVAAVTAGLRALAQAGDPRDDVAAGLITAGQADRLTAMFGRAATERVVLERAWTWLRVGPSTEPETVLARAARGEWKEACRIGEASHSPAARPRRLPRFRAAASFARFSETTTPRSSGAQRRCFTSTCRWRRIFSTALLNTPPRRGPRRDCQPRRRHRRCRSPSCRTST